MRRNLGENSRLRGVRELTRFLRREDWPRTLSREFIRAVRGERAR